MCLNLSGNSCRPRSKRVVCVLKLIAIGVISCGGESDVFEIDWQFALSPVEESWMCLKLTANGVVSCRGELGVLEIDGDWCGLLSRRVGRM